MRRLQSPFISVPTAVDERAEKSGLSLAWFGLCLEALAVRKTRIQIEYLTK